MKKNWELQDRSEKWLEAKVVPSLGDIGEDYKYYENGIVEFEAAIWKKALLNSTERILLDRLCHRMDKSNSINYNPESLYNISRFIEEHTKKKITKKALVNAFLKLIKVGFILEPFEPGVFIINPIFYSCGTPQDRVELIASILKEAENSPIKRKQLEDPMQFDNSLS
jgi:hypothetical protein